MTRRLAFALPALALMGFAASRPATAQDKKAAAPAPAGACGKTFGSGKCCDPSVVAHLNKAAIFSSCGKSDAVYLGERGGKDECRYYFKVEGQKDEEMYVSVYTQTLKPGQPAEPTDPFVTWKKISGSVYLAQPKTLKKEMSAKVKAVDTSSAVGLWLSGKGYYVTVSAPSKVCSQSDAKRLASSLR